ncbi:GNAT family N-acetyltransferase [Natronobacterium gregoryi]|uniref:Acetyltransferase n=2 Tax=Natronobacterium gregoryi TaxID=44930 RepID=L0AF36_NATGS|nr:GNAT family N-acetyltransferase [Natronobacterium gregoryi]AFZ71742.1 putative acetyltransferase [Natronobacterium gregoryi SP2]ELY72871.1 GCN5-like N-acetyltransferase [Natronobacterium gregoryi SP2]PLK21075.1 GNAT family N-acetyltransferase [Natronobacterium gregoryi SP2]SFI88843.1 Predicted N-acetyltransferase YhbS [Natronobacterium gregoryi]
MKIREATQSDVDAIRSIADRSLGSTYTDFLSEATVSDAIDQWYGDGFEDDLEDDDTLVLVVERDGDVVAFSQTELVGKPHRTGKLLWLHVDPDHRGDGTGVRLLVRTRETLLEAGAEQVQGFVLADNEGGNQFYRDHGFEKAGKREVEIGSETFTEAVYVESELEDEGWGAIDELEVDGETVFISYGEAARGSKSPFYTAYQTEDREKRYGWLCGNCDSLDNAMDTMGRIECNVCGNRRKATRWDASYL